MLLHLPDGHNTESVRDALIVAMTDLPAHLRGSPSWDQGAELARHRQFSMVTGMALHARRSAGLPQPSVRVN